MGVSAPLLLPCPVENMITPALHYGLGGGNWIEVRVRKDLTILEKGDPRRIASVSALELKIGNAEASLCLLVSDIAGAISFEVMADTPISAVLVAGINHANHVYATYMTVTAAAGQSCVSEEALL